MGIFNWSSNKKPKIPDIGRDIEYTDIIGHAFRVLDFDRNGTAINENGKVIAKNMFKPYGYLLVESPILNQQVRMPIFHQDDFLLAASVYDNAFLAESLKNGELLVTYIPEQKLPRNLAGNRHALHYTLTNDNILEKYYEINGGIHKTQPEPEKLFKNIVWSGEIKVSINSNPEL